MYDFLILGGGIAGVSACARLAPLGKVLLLEAEEHLAHHASGRSAAMFEESYGKPATIVLNRASRAFHEEAQVLSPRGMMLVARPDQAEAYAADVAAMGLTPITVDQARAMVPILSGEAVAFAAHSDAAQDIDTHELLQVYLRAARANGAEIVTRARAERIVRTRTGWVVSAAGNDHEARIVVNAAGAWVDQVARMAGVAPLGVTPLRRSMARLPAPGGHDVSRWPMLFGAGETWYAKPDAGALLVSPADEDPVEPHDAWADDLVLAEGLARYEEMVTQPVTRLIASWAGLRTFAPDRTLVIGFAPDEPTFFWLAGQGGYGMQTSPAASLLAADLVAGRTPDLDPDIVAALSPARFA